MSLALLSPAASVAASAQSTQTTQTAQTQNTSSSAPTYVTYCVGAIDQAIGGADIDAILRKVFHLKKLAYDFDLSIAVNDTLKVRYDWENKQYFSAPFDASIALYDILGLIPGTSSFWQIGQPATSCLEAAVIWDLQTGKQVGTQLRKDVDNVLYGLTPTGLTVGYDPSDGTVLHLTWDSPSMSPLTAALTSLLSPGFQVSSSVGTPRSINASLGTVHYSYTWNGLQPGTEACFKVRATWSLGDSAWFPNATPSPICARSSSPSPPSGPCTPKINAVGSFQAIAAQTVEITGSCFGTGNTSSGADTAYFRISDLTAGWNACWTGDPNTDQVTCNISSWTNQQITFTGLTGYYGQYGWVITSGDQIQIQVWNPQSGQGPATYQVVAK